MACGKAPVRVFEVCRKLTLFTNGTTTFIPREFTPKELNNIGPFLVGVTVHASCEDRSANFEYKVTGAWSYDEEEWTPFAADILSAQTANGGVISPQYTTKTDFGLHVRFVISARNTTGAAMENGVVSVTLIFQLIS